MLLIPVAARSGACLLLLGQFRWHFLAYENLKTYMFMLSQESSAAAMDELAFMGPQHLLPVLEYGENLP